MDMQDWPESVEIEEKGPRDGFQNEATPIPTEKKIEIVNALSRTGLRHIQVTSFVHPKWVPQLADAEEVLRGIDHVPGVTYNALVLNERGLQRAVRAGVSHIEVGVSASETHSLKNVNRPVDQALRDTLEIIRRAKGEGMAVQAAVMCTFGCAYEGGIARDASLRIAEAFGEAGAGKVALADTTGMGNPRQVYEIFSAVRDRLEPEVELAAHFHDTRGAGLANVLAAMEAGCRSFDTSVGGLGGCPFVPGATGNVCTGDVVNMLQEMGIATAIDLARLLEVERMVQAIVGHPLPAHVAVAGMQIH